jgi:hypothetical protein
MLFVICVVSLSAAWGFGVLCGIVIGAYGATDK